MRKVTLDCDFNASLFFVDVLVNGGDAYRWPCTNTVVFRGDIPTGYNYTEEHCSQQDELMLWVG